MKLGRKIIITFAIGIIALQLAGCSNTSNQLKSIATPSGTSGSSAPATSAAASMTPSAVVSASREAVSAALKKDQLKSLEQPLTGLLLTVEEYGKDYPGGNEKVDPEFAQYYLYYIANNYNIDQAKKYSKYVDPAFSEFIAYTASDADKLLNSVFGKRFSSKDLPAFDSMSQGNIAFTDNGTVYVGANLGGPSTVTYAGGDVSLQNGSAEVQYQYYYVPMTHGLEYNGALTATITPDASGTLVITGLTIQPLAEDTASDS